MIARRALYISVGRSSEIRKGITADESLDAEPEVDEVGSRGGVEFHVRYPANALFTLQSAAARRGAGGGGGQARPTDPMTEAGVFWPGVPEYGRSMPRHTRDTARLPLRYFHGTHSDQHSLGQAPCGNLLLLLTNGSLICNHSSAKRVTNQPHL